MNWQTFWQHVMDGGQHHRLALILRLPQMLDVPLHGVQQRLRRLLLLASCTL